MRAKEGERELSLTFSIRETGLPKKDNFAIKIFSGSVDLNVLHSVLPQVQLMNPKNMEKGKGELLMVIKRRDFCSLKY